MKKIKEAFKNIEKILNEKKDYIFTIAFSGGKDSSALLVLFFHALLKLPSDKRQQIRFNIISSNTLMEFPPYEIYLFNTLKKLNIFIKKYNLNGNVYMTAPDKRNKFFNLIIGKGQPLPRKDARWCSDRLKILPQNTLLKEIIKNNPYITMIGSRKEESANRAARLTKNDLGNGLKQGNNNLLFAPLEDLTTAQVWYIIKNLNQEWLDNKKLLNLYQIASNLNSPAPTARFGCFVCPLVSEDNTFKNFLNKYPQYKPLYDFRNFIVKYQNIWYDKEKDKPVRDVFNHRNYKINYYKFDNQRKEIVSPGGYNLQTRIMFFKKLLNALIQVKLKDKSFPAHLYLSKSDIIYIQEKWLIDGDVKLSAFKLVNKYLNADLSFNNLNEDLKNYYIFFIKTVQKDIVLNDTYFNKPNDFNYFRTYLKMIEIFLNLDATKQILKKNPDLDDLVDIFLKSKSSIYNQLLKSGYYVGNKAFEELVFKTWKEDMPDYFTLLKRYNNNDLEKPMQSSLFEEYSNNYIERFFKIYEENLDNVDLLDSKHLSLEEKYAFIESFRKSYPK